jgi:hypothetical protein
MKKRNVIMVLLLSLITLGIYGIYWEVVTKKEMVSQGADIPTAWLIIIPLVNIWWLYKYCMGVEKVSGGKMSGILLFILFILFSIVAMAVAQDTFNKVADAPALAPVSPAGESQAPVVTATEQSVPAVADEATPAETPVSTTPVVAETPAVPVQSEATESAPSEPVASAPAEPVAEDDEQNPTAQPPSSTTTPTPIA